MDLIGHARRLQVLVEVADRGSFTAAAASLLMTQSAVSQHVAGLERATATALVERGTRPVVLTEAGQALTRHARAVLARLDSAEQEVMEMTARRHGRLRLGSFPTALATFVPPALATFWKRYPKVTLTVVDDHHAAAAAPPPRWRAGPGDRVRRQQVTCAHGHAPRPGSPLR